MLFLELSILIFRAPKKGQHTKSGSALGPDLYC